MKLTIVAIVLLLVEFVDRSRCDRHVDQDFYRHFFDDNLSEMEDEPIEFGPKPVPKWLRGSYIRNGIGQLRTEKRTMKHIFDGFAKLNKVEFAEQSKFTAKFVKSAFYNESKAMGDVALFHLFKGPDPPFSMYEGLKAVARGMDNMNVNVIRLKGNGSEYLALNDIWPDYQFAPNLDTIARLEEPVPGLSQFWSKLSIMSTSHPVEEYGTRNQINIVSTINPLGGGWMNLVRLKAAKNRELIASWKVDRVPYLHSFAVTQNYAVLICAPTYLDLAGMLHYWAPIDGLVTEKDGTSQIFVVDLHNGEVKRIDKKGTGFMMHYINGHEEGNRILVDGIVYESMQILGSPDVEIITDKEARKRMFGSEGTMKGSKATRFVIDLEKLDIVIEPHNVTRGREFALKVEMPVINENYRHRPNCFVYGLASNDAPEETKLVKKDLCNKGRDLVWGVEEHYPTEPWFVANPEGSDEDDGLLMVYMMDGPRKTSYLALLDARDMTMYSKAELPTFVPWGLHGRFFPDEMEGQCEKGKTCS